MTAYVVEMNDPSLPKGATVQVAGIGLLTNHEATYVSPEQAEAFRDAHRFGEETGPTVVQGFHGHDTIKARQAKKGDEPKEPEPDPDPEQPPVLITTPPAPDTEDQGGDK